jgi:2-polyprenyl-6-methoxyphenol hydroxylase-like FAD-dependent oxidoreductase
MERTISTEPKAVTIVGAGIAGLCLALVLRKHHVEFRVIEQAPELTEIGAGIQISANGMRVLRWLGLEGSMKALACNPRFFRAVDWRDGRELHTIAYREEHFQIHRADLLDILKAPLPARAIQLGERVTSFEQTDDAVAVATDRGTYRADTLIGADGIHSTVRAFHREYLLALRGRQQQTRGHPRAPHLARPQWPCRHVPRLGRPSRQRRRLRRVGALVRRILAFARDS